MDFFCKNASHLFLLCSSTKTFTLSVFLSLQYNLSFSITLFVSLQYILSLNISFSHLRALSLCLSSLPNSLYLFFSLNNILSHNSLSLSSFPHSHHTVASFSFFQNQAQCGKKVDRRQCSKDFTFKLQPFFPSLFHFLIWLFHCLSFSKPFFFHFLSAIPYLHHHSTIHKTNYQSRYIVD